MKIKYIILLFFFTIIFSCAAKKTENEKDERTAMKRLEPIELKAKEEINDLAALNIKNSLATINSKGEFSILTIDEQGSIKIEPIVPGFPPTFGGKFFSDDEHNFLWMIAGRGVYCLDIETKKTGHCIATLDGNAEVARIFLADSEKKILYMEIGRPYPLLSYFILYNLLKDDIVFQGKKFKGTMYPFDYNNILFCEFTGENNEILSWQLIEKEYSQTSKKIENTLTKELTKLQISIWPDTKTINLKKRIIIGTARPLDKLTYFTARWDEKIEEVKIEPLVFQRPEKSRLSSKFSFSTDGNWVKTIAEIKSGSFITAMELLIYHVSDIYPQGMSLPIYCGYTKEDTIGAFMMHDTWGPCYVEQDPDVKGSLFVYKLNDGLKILAEEARKSVSGK